MRRYVNGLRYDTETATKVNVTVGNDYSRNQDVTVGPADLMRLKTVGEVHPGNDLWWEAELYVTPGGRWFLHGRGNSASPFNKPFVSKPFVSDDEQRDGSSIEPLLNGEVRKILEDGDQFALLDRYFSDEYEDA
jgi:hypothetical protein